MWRGWRSCLYQIIRKVVDSMDMEHTKQNTHGKVHTAELMLLSEKGADMQQDYHRDSRVTGSPTRGKHKGAPVCYLRFDPNELKVYSKQTSRNVPIGDCESLADFRQHVEDWARVEGVPPDAIAFSRADFAVDYCTSEGAEQFRQLCDMLILAFNIKHNVQPKDQYYGGTQTTMEHKNNKTKWETFELECYRKEIQSKNSGIQWRFEMRYIQNKRRKKRKIYRDILPMLNELRAELRTLSDYYEAAQKAMNDTLVCKFEESRAGSGGAVRLNEFIFLNRDRVFSRDQLKGLFTELGSKNPAQSAYNYTKGHKAHRLIDDKMFSEFVKMLNKSIGNWVNNYQNLTDFFEGRNGASTDNSTGAPCFCA